MAMQPPVSVDILEVNQLVRRVMFFYQMTHRNFAQLEAWCQGDLKTYLINASGTKVRVVDVWTADIPSLPNPMIVFALDVYPQGSVDWANIPNINTQLVVDNQGKPVRFSTLYQAGCKLRL